ncbi:MAG: lipocalin family protein [Bacteroidales bacterium]|nr:lipocalin family protein [Bacteroidales bacterium]
MNRILKMTALLPTLMMVFGFVACNKEKTDTVEYLDVTYANLNGTWLLSEWDGVTVDTDAATAGEGTYCYITFDRREHTFTMYQNFDSMYARRITGSFSLATDAYLGEVVSGKYDYDNGAWNHDYIISNLLSDSMVWTATDDPLDVCLYVRVDEVPEEIVAEARDDSTRSSASFNSIL